MPISIRVIGGDVLERIGQLMPARREKLMQDLTNAATVFGFDVVAIAKRDYLSGPKPGKLMHQTGRLASSITSKATRDGNVINTTVGTNVEYAPIHEFGGTVKPNLTDRMRKFAWAMFYKSKDEMWKRLALSRKSRLSIKIPARPFLRPALKDAMPSFEKNIQRVLKSISFQGA